MLHTRLNSMTRPRMARVSAAAVFAATAIALASAQAQQPAPKGPSPAQVQKSEPALAPPGAATAPPAAPPSWQQGRSAEQSKSPLHPIAPILTGRPASELPVSKLKVPAGFKVEIWAEGIPEARSLALGDKGTVFVSNRNLSSVYAVTDRGGKREVKELLKGLKAPNGLAFSKGTLFVAERNRITRYDGIEGRLDNPPEAKVVIDNHEPARSLLEVSRAGAGRQALLQHRGAGQHRDAELHAGFGEPRRSEYRSDGEGRRGRAQFRRHGLSSRDEGALVYEPRPGLAW